jgi:bifunctional NMN adenylyltransferase/nudix hydrolase
VRGRDDADKARWLAVAEALEMSPRLFEDRLHIFECIVGRGRVRDALPTP